ncbi:MAG: DUF1501 domain-containing protein [Planctomycetes bacterium]|nr:DUF1501 domain-containing protein [Planctomycetota bacterium]
MRLPALPVQTGSVIHVGISKGQLLTGGLTVFPTNTNNNHHSRRAFLKATLATAGGLAIANWGALFNSETIAQEARRSNKRCILLWANGGASQIDTFDMKPGRPTGGPFRPIQTNVNGIQICEYMPLLARHVDKLAMIRSMRTQSPDHPDGIYHMHTCYKQSERMPHPEIGAMIAKYLGNPDSDLPSFIRMGSTGNAGSGYLGPRYEPFHLGSDGRLPYFSAPLVTPAVQDRRSELLDFMEQERASRSGAEAFESHRLAEQRALRLMRTRQVFNIDSEWQRAQERYGSTSFGRCCFMARKLIENGVPFVEVGQENYDSHADNFVCHKANMDVLDPAWSGLLTDLAERNLLANTLVVWMGEVGRTPYINNRAGRDHFIRAWTIVLAGGGVRGGQVYGATDRDGREVANDPVSEGDLFATIYTALGINPRVRHFVGARPIWATPEGARALRPLLA